MQELNIANLVNANCGGKIVYVAELILWLLGFFHQSKMIEQNLRWKKVLSNYIPIVFFKHCNYSCILLYIVQNNPYDMKENFGVKSVELIKWFHKIIVFCKIRCEPRSHCI